MKINGENLDKMALPVCPEILVEFFFGIGKKYVNGQNLEIVANGGKGGPGQNGYPGKNGEDGDAANLPVGFDSCPKNLCDNILYKLSNCKCETFEVIIPAGKFPIFIIQSLCEVTFLGEPGKPGGKGGRGGRGGKGGKPGFIVLFELIENSKISRGQNDGEAGENGRGGIGYCRM